MGLKDLFKRKTTEELQAESARLKDQIIQQGRAVKTEHSRALLAQQVERQRNALKLQKEYIFNKSAAGTILNTAKKGFSNVAKATVTGAKVLAVGSQRFAQNLEASNIKRTQQQNIALQHQIALQKLKNETEKLQMQKRKQRRPDDIFGGPLLG